MSRVIVLGVIFFLSLPVFSAIVPEFGVGGVGVEKRYVSGSMGQTCSDWAYGMVGDYWDSFHSVENEPLTYDTVPPESWNQIGRCSVVMTKQFPDRLKESVKTSVLAVRRKCASDQEKILEIEFGSYYSRLASAEEIGTTEAIQESRKVGYEGCEYLILGTIDCWNYAVGDRFEDNPDNVWCEVHALSTGHGFSDVDYVDDSLGGAGGGKGQLRDESETNEETFADTPEYTSENVTTKNAAGKGTEITVDQGTFSTYKYGGSVDEESVTTEVFINSDGSQVKVETTRNRQYTDRWQSVSGDLDWPEGYIPATGGEDATSGAESRSRTITVFSPSGTVVSESTESCADTGCPEIDPQAFDTTEPGQDEGGDTGSEDGSDTGSEDGSDTGSEEGADTGTEDGTDCDPTVEDCSTEDSTEEQPEEETGDGECDSTVEDCPEYGGEDDAEGYGEGDWASVDDTLSGWEGAPDGTPEGLSLGWTPQTGGVCQADRWDLQYRGYRIDFDVCQGITYFRELAYWLLWVLCAIYVYKESQDAMGGR